MPPITLIQACIIDAVCAAYSVAALSSYPVSLLGSFFLSWKRQQSNFMYLCRSTGEYAVSFEVWHEKLLKNAEAYYQQKLAEAG